MDFMRNFIIRKVRMKLSIVKQLFIACITFKTDATNREPPSQKIKQGLTEINPAN